MEFSKNDYKIYKVLKDFSNKNPIGKFLKPLLKNPSKLIYPLLPQPRDFILKQIPKNGIFCEVGVYTGTFSERVERICNPKTLYLIDPWQEDTTDERYSQKNQDERYYIVSDKFRKQISSGKVVIIRKTSDEAVSDFDDLLFDFVYVDGNHAYEQVKKDLINYYPKVKRGGLLCGDDYNFKDVRQAVDEFAKEKNITPQIKNEQFVFKK